MSGSQPALRPGRSDATGSQPALRPGRSENPPSCCGTVHCSLLLFTEPTLAPLLPFVFALSVPSAGGTVPIERRWSGGGALACCAGDVDEGPRVGTIVESKSSSLTTQRSRKWRC